MDYDSAFECTCPVYARPCHVLFYRHEAKNSASQARNEIEERRNTLSQSKMDRFYSFTYSIVSKTKDDYEEMRPQGSIDDAMLMTSMHLFSSPTIQEDVGLCNEI